MVKRDPFWMRMITLYVPKEWVLMMDLLVKDGIAPSRSELIRYAIRDVLIAEGKMRPHQKEVF